MNHRRRTFLLTRLAVWPAAMTASAYLLGCARSSRDKAAPPVEPATAPSAPAANPRSPSRAAPATAPAPGTKSDKLLVTEDEYQGWKYYAVYCERCHAPDAVGTADAPDLRYSVSSEGQVTPDSFRVIVRNGTENREENKVMKGFADLLDDQRISQIYAYITARSEGRLAPGRPHRAPQQ